MNPGKTTSPEAWSSVHYDMEEILFLLKDAMDFSKCRMRLLMMV